MSLYFKNPPLKSIGLFLVKFYKLKCASIYNMADNVPNYNPQHVVHMLYHMKNGLEHQMDTDPINLIGDSEKINDVVHKVLQSLEPRKRRAIELHCGLPDIDPVMSYAEGGLQFYLDLKTPRPKRHTTIEVPLEFGEEGTYREFVTKLANEQGVPLDYLVSATVSLKSDDRGTKGIGSIAFRNHLSRGSNMISHPTRNRILSELIER